jgi:hypothetical protein
MAWQVHSEGMLELLARGSAGTYSDFTLTLRAFTNNFTPAESDVASAFTEASGGGYSAISLQWSAATVAAVSNIATAAWAQQTTTFTGALTGSATIYGVYLTTPGGKVFASALITPTYQPAASGDILRGTPALQFGRGTPA